MPACARLETSASAAPNGKFSERMTSPFSFRKALAFAEREDAWPRAPRLAEARRHRDAAGRFQESASFWRRNSLGVSPVAALKARLNGPIDWQPASRAIVS